MEVTEASSEQRLPEVSCVSVASLQLWPFAMVKNTPQIMITSLAQVQNEKTHGATPSQVSIEAANDL